MKLESWTLIGAILFYMAACSTARAADADIRFRNEADQTLTRIRVLPTLAEHSVQCAAKATCSQRIALPHGVTDVRIEALATGPAWSGPSNVVAYRATDPAPCLADAACRFDVDGNGQVTVGDFGGFMKALGSSW